MKNPTIKDFKEINKILDKTNVQTNKRVIHNIKKLDLRSKILSLEAVIQWNKKYKYN